jgi:hypothetical protein
MAKQKKIEFIKQYSEDEASEIAKELIVWLHEKEEHILIDEFLLTKKQIFAIDIIHLINTNPNFAIIIEQAKQIELTKLLKYASGDKLNSTMVKQILINKHNWI